MKLFEWTEDLRVGNDLIDRDHRYLIDLINQLYVAMLTGKAKAVLGQILNELIQYTSNHFGREETWMQAIAYPEYETHKAEHDKLMASVLDIRDRFNAGLIIPPVSVFNFLSDWLFKHIKACDAKLGQAVLVGA